MSAKKPIRFFFPVEKVDKPVQTPFFLEKVTKRNATVDKLRSETIEALTSQQQRPPDGVALSYKLDYNSRLQFYLANMNDADFDVLTPPPNLFEDYPVSFEVEFCNDFMQFVAIGSPLKVEFKYDHKVFPLIESLESGFVDRELLHILVGQLKITEWENGFTLCKITDFRFPEPVEHKRMLRLSDDVIGDFLDREPGHSLETERAMIEAMHPQVCIDPSPDVARAQSVTDWRQKMWRRKRELQDKDTVIHAQAGVKKETQGNVILRPLTQTIVIPDAIFQAIAQSTVRT